MTVLPDAQPDSTQIRLQVHLAARGGCRVELAEAVREIGQAAAGTLGDTARVTLLIEIDDDPFPSANPLCRPFDVVLEIEAPEAIGADALLDPLSDMHSLVVDLAHLDLSGAFVGSPQAIIECDSPPLRYLYLMRRRAHTTHAAYIDYYFHSHSRFGFATPNIAGYTQFHVDDIASASAASRLGLGSTVVDSVSELSLESLELFFAGIGDGRLGAEAAEDEALFVDRDNSVSFVCTSEVLQA